MYHASESKFKYSMDSRIFHDNEERVPSSLTLFISIEKDGPCWLFMTPLRHRWHNGQHYRP